MLSNGTFSLHARRSLMTIKIILMDVRKAKAVQEYRVRHDIANVNELEAGKLLENLKASAIVMIWSLSLGDRRQSNSGLSVLCTKSMMF